MATYNGAMYLREQLDSILSQLRAGDELIVSDDASIDSTLEILRSYGESLRIVGEHRAGGVVRNFSRVLGHASRDLVLLADQDDVWLPGRVARMREELTRCDLVFTNAWVVDEHLQKTGETLFEQLNVHKGFWRNLWRNSAFVGCCMGFRQSLLTFVLPMPKRTPWHDWLLGLVATTQGRVTQVDTPTLLYRRHASNTSLTGGKSHNALLRKVQLRLNMLSALSVCYWRRQRGFSR